jgi:hypothetical protein
MIKQIKDTIQFAAIAAPIYAADSVKFTNKGTTNFSSLETLSINGMVSGAISLVLIVVALIFFFILIIGGIKWITSGGDEKKVAAARSEITNALIGLVIVFAAWAIMKLIGTVFGITLIGGDLTIPTFN